MLLFLLFGVPLRAQDSTPIAPPHFEYDSSEAKGDSKPASSPHAPRDSSSITVRRPSAGQLEEFMSDDDFAYDRPVEEPTTFWEQVIRWLERKLGDLLDSTSGNFWKVLAYLALGATMVYVTMRMIGVEPVGMFVRSAKGPDMKAEVGEENIHAMDFDALIADAIRRREFRWAIRLHYLRSLRALADREIIAWKPDKTNHEYVRELKRTDLSGPFRQITRLFEYAWYGNVPVDDAAYRRAEQHFTEFHHQLSAGR